MAQNAKEPLKESCEIDDEEINALKGFINKTGSESLNKIQGQMMQYQHKNEVGNDLFQKNQELVKKNALLPNTTKQSPKDENPQLSKGGGVGVN